MSGYAGNWAFRAFGRGVKEVMFAKNGKMCYNDGT